MEKSHIFLFTSNHLEGWGAVVNEAMNSGCAVVASAEAGAVPFLIRNGENGLTYRKNSYEECRDAVCWLMEHEKERSLMGQEACRTIVTQWNAECAAARCLEFYDSLTAGRMACYEDGPFSPAPVIRPGR